MTKHAAFGGIQLFRGALGASLAQRCDPARWGGGAVPLSDASKASLRPLTQAALEAAGVFTAYREGVTDALRLFVPSDPLEPDERNEE